jgi:hypothetical protein
MTKSSARDCKNLEIVDPDGGKSSESCIAPVGYDKIFSQTMKIISLQERRVLAQEVWI